MPKTLCYIGDEAFFSISRSGVNQIDIGLIGNANSIILPKITYFGNRSFLNYTFDKDIFYYFNPLYDISLSAPFSDSTMDRKMKNCNVLNDDICSTLNTDDVDDCLLVVPTIPASTENNVETILLEIENNIKVKVRNYITDKCPVIESGQSNEDEVDQILDDLRRC